jgi:transketolase
VIPELVGGSADLTPSNNTKPDGWEDFQRDTPQGRYFRFGVREHGMGAITNGIVLCNLRPYAGTFFNFLDYMKAAVRLSSLSELAAIWVYTHDSVGLGEDGPTHQPIEQLATLRAQPNIAAFRPADANETSVGWRLALERKLPTALVLSRQALPILDPKRYPVHEAARGGYVLDGDDDPELLLIGTGAEVHLALQARETLSERGVASRVVSLPSWEIFEQQDRSYRESVIPPDVEARVTVEAASPLGWERYAGPHGEIIGLDRFGASAPGTTALEKLGFVPERVVEAAERVLSANRV